MDDEAKELLRELRDIALRGEKRGEAAQAEMQKLAGARAKIVALVVIMLLAAGGLVLYGFSILSALSDKVKVM